MARSDTPTGSNPVNNIPACGTCEKPEQILSNYVNNGLPLIEVTYAEIPGLMYILFNAAELDSTDTSRSINLKFKPFGEGVTGVLTDGDCRVEWRERINGFSKTKILTTSATNTITVSSLDELQGIGPNTSVLIISTAGGATRRLVAVVQSVNTTTGELLLDRVVSVVADDVIFRGHNSRNDCDDISNNYTTICEVPYHSNFQKLQLSMTFSMCELNVDRAIYSGDEDVNTYVNRLWKPNRDGFVREMAHAFWRGENVTGSGSIKQQTRGLFTSIVEAQTCTGKALIHDLEDCCGTDDDDQIINAIIDITTDAWKSGFYNKEPITAVINSAGVAELMKMQADFYAFAGYTILEQNANESKAIQDFVYLRLISMWTPFTRVDYVLDHSLDEWYPDSSIMVLMPKSMVGLYQKKYKGLDDNMRAVLNSSSPTLQMKNITHVTGVRNLEECMEFVGGLEFALVFGGVYSGAYRVIKNFQSYRSCNATCPITTPGYL